MHEGKRLPRLEKTQTGFETPAVRCVADGETPQASRQIDRLAAALAEQTVLVHEQSAYIARYKKMYDRASAMARIGVWECDLATETLTWTDGVYDIFELPRGSAVSRPQTLLFYHDDSRVAMSALRQKAIEDAGSFQLDIRVRTAKGNDRWVRLTADIECEDGRPVRIFGMKQDITKEKEAADHMRILAESDPLTGLANRGVFQTKLGEEARSSLGALVLIDLDGFKRINDTFGHAAGDACLKQISSRLRLACNDADLVARIGGDEFAILLSGPRDRTTIEIRVAQILAEIRPPVAWNAETVEIGASAGIAIPHVDRAPSPTTLFNEADSALYAAKKAGANSFRTFDQDIVCGLTPLPGETGEAPPVFA